jgi:hypothetical protein
MEFVGAHNGEKERLLWNLRSLPIGLADLVGSLDDQTLRWRPIPTKWSVKEILCHLRDFEREAMQFRYRSMLAQDDPYLPRLDNDAKQAAGDYINQDGAVLLADLRGLRGETIALLEAAPARSWARTGRHFSAGRVTLEQIVARHATHDMIHLGQMRDIIGLKLPWNQRLAANDASMPD